MLWRHLQSGRWWQAVGQRALDGNRLPDETARRVPDDLRRRLPALAAGWLADLSAQEAPAGLRRFIACRRAALRVDLPLALAGRRVGEVLVLDGRVCVEIRAEHALVLAAPCSG